VTASTDGPCLIDVYDDTQSRFLFFRERQIYSAGMMRDGEMAETSIRDFLLATSRMNFPQMRWYQLDNKTLHSTLILFQKKPALTVMTNLVDLDELLDKAETEGKSCVVSATRRDFIAILRYEKGRATAIHHGESQTLPSESSFRDDFLVKIYTITTEEPVTIKVHEDLLVSYAADAKTIPDTFNGRFEELYLSRPPVISLRFKDKELDHWVFDKPVFNIGRTPDNDITIDNLAVSRLHAVLEEEKGDYYVRDCDSLNGIVVNGRKVGRAKLADGDEISIGKHTISFKVQGGQALPAEDTVQGFDQTVILDARTLKPSSPTPQTTTEIKPRLIIKTAYGDRVVELKDETLTIGKDADADVYVEGPFVARRHVEIVREDGKIILRKLGSIRRVKVDGKNVSEVELKDNHEIRIAKEAFIFQA
jgi:pSer/pThr/pTyr-binding forkhead associated (FHA) protein